MNYRALFIAFVVLPLGLGHAVYGQNVSYHEGLGRAAERIGEKVSRGDVVAVVEFRAATPQFSDRVIDDLIGVLSEVPVRVVDRQNLEALRAEQEYQYSGYVDEESAVSLGRELGATAIILGSGENMADYYRLSFRMVSVETGEILVQYSVNVRYDSAMRRLLGGRMNGIGTTHFMAGIRLGAGFEINTAHEDWVGNDYPPKEESNTAFNITLYGAFRFNDVWSLQAEMDIMLNNGMEVSGQGDDMGIEYATIDIPLLVRWNFIQSPVMAGLLVGPYISLPVGKLNQSWPDDDQGTAEDDRGSALTMNGYTLGIAFGFALGCKLGPGNLAADVRYINDFRSLYVNEPSEGIYDQNICIRRSINITVGYEFSL
ncbi:MAG: outer membrane beta-barrel protein [Spirochaetaceae bacterium]|nr:outer membrane beta-barrel protein [Spirochaetaceae bacterium]